MALNFDHVIVKADGKTAAVINEFEPVRVKSPNASVFAVHSSWEGIPNKPATFPPSPHIHDDRYYTEEETDALLEPKLEADDLQWGMMQGNIEDQADLMEKFTNTGTVSGDSVHVEDAAVAPVISAKTVFTSETPITSLQYYLCGKNLVNMAAVSKAVVAANIYVYDPNTNGIHIATNEGAEKGAGAAIGSSSNLIIPAGKVTISFKIGSNAIVGTNTFLCLRDSGNSYQNESRIKIKPNTLEYSLTYNNNCPRYVNIFADYTTDDSARVPVDFWVYDLQIEVGTEKTSYEPYRGTTYNAITFPDGVSSISSGVYDAVSGELTVLDDPENPVTYQLAQNLVVTTSGIINAHASIGEASVTYWKNTAEGQQMGTAAKNAKEYTDRSIFEVNDRMDQIEHNTGIKRYGVSGVGNSAAALTRLYDSVGMTAQVGTDGDNSAVINDFDHAEPFMLRKCVGTWTLNEGHAVFHVESYYGDADYAEDGTKGDYVAVECPLSYYYRSGTELTISAHRYPGYRPFDIFCREHNPEDVMPYVYLPAYALAMKDGHAVSLPDLDNLHGSYKTLMDSARTYQNGALGGKAMIDPAAVNFYLYALMTVEFATQNMQLIMAGCCDLQSADSTVATFLDATHVLTAYADGYVAGQRICISDVTSHYSGNYAATHKVTEVVRCNASGAASSSGTYVKLTVVDLGKGYIDYQLGTEYYIASRPYQTGACNSVGTPSGSPVSNSDGYHPCRYRYIENPYGNQYYTAADIFARRILEESNVYHLDYYILTDPETYTEIPESLGTTDLNGDKFTLLDIQTPSNYYVNGYMRIKTYSDLYPDVWCSGRSSGGSSDTYYCDYAYLVNSTVVRSVRFSGSWYAGLYDGPSFVAATTATSLDLASFGAHLFIKQG